MGRRKKEISGCIIREGVCQKSDKEIIHSALLGKAKQLERVLLRQKSSLSTNEHKQLQDEYERTFALTERYRR